jgi:hypothetical protein
MTLGLVAAPFRAGAIVIVETYGANAVLTAQLPGTSGGGTTTFDYTFNYLIIDFAPGAVVFNGQPVDFDGTEVQWLASAESGQFIVGATGGPAIADVQVNAAWSGPVTISELQGQATGVMLGPAFSSSNLDGVSGSGYPIHHTLTGTNLPVPPGTLTHDANHILLLIDAANGLVSLAMEGSFSLTGPVSVVPLWWGGIKAL